MIWEALIYISSWGIGKHIGNYLMERILNN
jgi:hypothetical protein